MNATAVLERLIDVVGISGGPQRLKPLIETQLVSHFGILPLVAAESAERLESQIIDLIIERETEYQSQGEVFSLTLSSISKRSIMGSCHVEPSDNDRVAEVKRRRLKVSDLLNSFRSLTFDEFEQFGASILRELGADFAKVTPRSGDQGIDFYGVLSIGRVAGEPTGISQLSHDLKLRFAGQAKHYPNSTVGPSAVRELVGSVSLARYKDFTSETEIFDDLELLSFNPIITMIFTTGSFTRGARELAEKAGIIARSGEQLAVFLADRGVGMIDGDDGLEFNLGAFQEWLTGND